VSVVVSAKAITALGNFPQQTTTTTAIKLKQASKQVKRYKQTTNFYHQQAEASKQRHCLISIFIVCCIL